MKPVGLVRALTYSLSLSSNTAAASEERQPLLFHKRAGHRGYSSLLATRKGHQPCRRGRLKVIKNLNPEQSRTRCWPFGLLRAQPTSASALKASAIETGNSKQRHSDEQSVRAAHRLINLVCLSYFCNVFVFSLPIVLMPVIAAGTDNAGALVAALASVATMGCAFGKILNGFVCQYMGCRTASTIYFGASSLVAFLLSTSTSNFGLGFAAMEFFASIQWTASSVLLSDNLPDDQVPAATSKLALCSTAAVLACKLLSSLLFQFWGWDWRRVAKLGSVVALLGGLVMHFGVVSGDRSSSSAVGASTTSSTQQQQRRGAWGSIKSVMRSPLFWLAGISHSTASIVRVSDKLLGPFLQEVTTLPSKYVCACASDFGSSSCVKLLLAFDLISNSFQSESLCGGLTASVTIGFVHGLLMGQRKFEKLHLLQDKIKMWRIRYAGAALSAVALALTAFCFPNTNQAIAASVALLASATMASSISFQFYQSTRMVSNNFGRDQAVCMSFLDAVGYLLLAPILAGVSAIIQSETGGWPAAWAFIATLIGIGGVLMSRVMPQLFEPVAPGVEKT